MARAIESVKYTRRQWVHVAAMATGSAIARVQGDAWALPMMCSTGGVLLVLTLLLAAYRQRARDCAIGLILDGRERIPIAVVERQRRRLLSDRTRGGLASSLEDKVRQGSEGPALWARFAPVPFDPVVVSAVAGEIVEVIGLLRGPCASARGVALAEHLVEHALSPLYGRDVDTLREELRRIRDALKDAGA